MSEEQKKEPTFEQSLARLAARCTSVAGGSPGRLAPPFRSHIHPFRSVRLRRGISAARPTVPPPRADTRWTSCSARRKSSTTGTRLASAKSQ